MKTSFVAFVIASIASISVANQENQLLFSLESARVLQNAPSNGTTTYNTAVFAPSYSHEGDNNLSNEGITGIVLGFFVYAVFILYAVVMLINDNKEMHAKFNKIVEDKLTILRSEYNVQQAEIRAFEVEFNQNENSRGKKKVA